MTFGAVFPRVMRPAFGPGLAAAAGAALYIEDSFTGANGTNLNGWTPDIANTPGNTWVAALQSWSIISNRARGTNFQPSLLVIETGVADGVITMPAARGSFENGIAFRWVDNNNHWRAIISSVSGFALVEVTSGTETTRTFTSPADITTVATITVTLSGNSISADYKSTNLSYISSQHSSATKHGVYRRDWIDSGVAEWWKMV